MQGIWLSSITAPITWNVVYSDGNDKKHNSSPTLMWHAVEYSVVVICYVAVGNCWHGNVSIGGCEISLARPHSGPQPCCFRWPCHNHAAANDCLCSCLPSLFEYKIATGTICDYVILILLESHCVCPLRVLKLQLLNLLHTCIVVWSLLSIRPCKTGLISKPLQAPWFLWQYSTHHIRRI